MRDAYFFLPVPYFKLVREKTTYIYDGGSALIWRRGYEKKKIPCGGVAGEERINYNLI